MLSKSKIMRGLQCHKSLWLYKHQPELREISSATQAVFDTGTNVGLLAQELFPEGVDATEGYDWPNHQTAERTRRLIADGVDIIYEATYIYNDVLVAVDIMVKGEDGWNGYEVKSTNSVKKQHITDSAVQYHVITESGYKVNSFSVVTFNKEYVRMGELDIAELFATWDITEDAIGIQEDLPQIIQNLKEVQSASSCPEIDIGPHCSSPYQCDFSSHCLKDVPRYSVLNLTRAGSKGWELYKKGVQEIKDIPSEFTLSESQQIQYMAELTNKPRIDKEGIQHFLKNLTYPIYHFDFETIMPAVPKFDHSHTYQQIPFQYSLHKQHEEASDCYHYEFLADADGTDPRPELIKRMLQDLGNTGSILAFHSSFETMRIDEMAKDFPEFAKQLMALIPRVIDLEIPFRNKHYYTKEMQGRSSIKNVLPALVPELSYLDLEIQEGGTASTTFLQMTNRSFEGDLEKTRRDLLEYCKMDTLAMVRILERLYQVS